ncbi:hypothetical protein J6590_037557 [Homalodisca vitripennis]|nr:hypothetical protein J6590_037557 [Homalodisca vitripennis]
MWKCRGKTRKYNKATHQLNGRRDSAITLSTRPLDFDLCLRMGRELFGQAGANCVLGLKALDQLRQIKVDKKAEEVTKAARVAARIKKRKLEDMEEEEGPYGPGIYAVV